MNWLITHRQNQVSYAPGLAKMLRDLSEGLPFPQTAGPFKVSSQVFVTYLEPSRAAEFFDIFQCQESFRLPAPAGIGIRHPGE